MHKVVSGKKPVDKTKPQEQFHRSSSPNKFGKQHKQQATAQKTKIVKCAYCKLNNHTISECRKLQQKLANEKQNVAHGQCNVCVYPLTRKTQVVNIKQVSDTDGQSAVHPLFTPYCKLATIVRQDGSHKCIHTLRDTGAMQSLLKDSQDARDYINTGETCLLKGITGKTISVPLIEVHLQTDFLDESVLCGLVNELPEDIDFLIANDIWLKSHPLPDKVVEQAVVTRAAARKLNDTPSESQDIGHTQPKPGDNKEDTLPFQTPIFHELKLDSVTDRTTLVELQKSDSSLTVLRQKVSDNPNIMDSSYYFLQDNLLMHHTFDRKTNFSADRVVVPYALRLQVLQFAHDIPAAGHLGIKKTHACLRPHFYWPHMLKDVTHYCKSCDTCQREGKGRKIPPAPLVSVPLISEPWSRVAIDIVGPLPVCPKSGNRFILTCMDLATHCPEAIALKQHTAEEVANALSQIFSHFGFSEEILSDQGTEFTSELMHLFTYQFSITQIRYSPYHPETNGSCECFHRTLKSMLRAMVDNFSDSVIVFHGLFSHTEKSLWKPLNSAHLK